MPTFTRKTTSFKSHYFLFLHELFNSFDSFYLSPTSWAGRRSVSDTDSDDDGNHAASSEFGHTAANRPPSQFVHNLADRKFVGNTGSPQLSLAEFLQDE
jgi:hypothetical protein